MNAYSRRTKFFALSSILGIASLFVLPVLRAQAQEDDRNDPPTRVARISNLNGSVSIQPGGTGDWGAATKNRPVTIGDKLWVDGGARVELQAGQASMHLGDQTALSFLNLNQGITQMRLAEGKLNFRVRELRQGDTYEVDTPNLAFTVTEAGAFRIDANENGDYSSVTVLRGQGEIAAGGQSYPLHAGERADITGTDNNVQFSSAAAGEPDSLDRWAQERDLREEHSQSARYVSRDVVGYSDLDDYGDWRDEPTYGHVWVPRTVDVGWAPYSDGYWNWVSPWGWTWVDYEPWGFAPFHYGRWQYFGSYWGWCPGPIYATPYYGPAFVGFLGGGFGVGVGFGWGGGYGWFPLGWGEPFHPWYRYGGNYLHQVNVNNTVINNTTIINNNNFNNYQYAHNVNAVTTASHNAFVNGERINRGAMRVNEAGLRNARVTNNIAASPTRASFLGSQQMRGRVATPSSAVQNRAVMARTAPATGASHLPVRTMGAVAPSNSGRAAQNPTYGRVRGMTSAPGAGVNTTQRAQINANRPPSASANGATRSNESPRGWNPLNNSQQRGNSTAPRTWNTPGNNSPARTTQQGVASNRGPNTSSTNPAQMNAANRPPWARGSATAGYSSNARSANEVPRYTSNRPSSSPSPGNNRSYSAPSNNGNRPSASYNGGNRSYSPPSSNGNRSSSQPSYNNSRGYSAPSNSGNRPPAPYNGGNRSYSPPSSSGNRSNSQPSYNNNRGYSTPRSYSPPAARENSAPRSYSAPSYNGNRGGYSAPRSYSTPSYSAPRGGYSAPRSSGGGGYSAPRSSGGGGSYQGGGGGGYRGGGSGGGGSHSSGNSGSSNGGGSSHGHR